MFEKIQDLPPWIVYILILSWVCVWLYFYYKRIKLNKMSTHCVKRPRQRFILDFIGFLVSIFIIIHNMDIIEGTFLSGLKGINRVFVFGIIVTIVFFIIHKLVDLGCYFLNHKQETTPGRP